MRRENTLLINILLNEIVQGWVFGLTTEPVFASAAGSDEQAGGGTDEGPQMEVEVQQMR
jgi:hypothetical protein